MASSPLSSRTQSGADLCRPCVFILFGLLILIPNPLDCVAKLINKLSWSRHYLKHNLISHRGYFTHHDQRYQIKPLQGTDEGEHAVLPDSQGEPDTAKYKHADEHAGRKRRHLRISRSLKSPNVSIALKPMYFGCLSKDIRCTGLFRNN